LRNLNAWPDVHSEIQRYGDGTVATRAREYDLDLSVVAHSYRNGRATPEPGTTLRADDAIGTAERERPDVCLIDVQLAGGGIRAAEEIARRLPGTAIAVFTESERATDFFGAIRAGATGYLLMDADPERLPHALRAVVNGEAALPRHLVPLLIEEYRKLGRYGPLLSRRGAALTNREVEVLGLMADSLTTQEIADRLSVEPVTVRTHVSSILKKLDVTSRSEALKLLRR
jgi:DNA-binding NarL/FixJ family response regulator